MTATLQYPATGCRWFNKIRCHCLGLLLVASSATLHGSPIGHPGTPGGHAADGLYLNPRSSAALWVASHPGDAAAADVRTHLASQPTAVWFGGWSGDISKAVSSYVGPAADLGKIPILVAYNIPGRDCGQYSAGGAASLAAYQRWIHDFAVAIGARHAIVILEPDALPQLDCLSAEAKTDRLRLLNFAVRQLTQSAPNAWLYLDAGHSHWLSAEQAATRLAAAGIIDAHGFSLNVSNYRTDEESKQFGLAVSAALQRQIGVGKPFVVDSSRNGNGPLERQWCDPAGRRIGAAPALHGPGGAPEMNLWIKAPGNADGCAAAAGSFVPALAYKLIYGN